ncbi:DNA-binding protein WhiA [Vulcanibacillus modesticaldus]|uniref:Probable cell division protein WhiA n=1 Tax=Vulcanibacillus modesticaldus TaxID=337097 RepID=A0A1D2YSN7_9BACI|nr:DNA-binding protein WhiA [Vulcanibacillus modesticaldus]OEF97791.1 DNA-binding protein WhiA [Vulcanibacillus modesticaldus]
MSFASETKKELTYVEGKDFDSKIAELSALVKMNGSVQLTNQKVIIDVLTENAAIARKIYSLIKELFHVQAELMVRKKMRLKKNNIYVVRIPGQVEQILKRLAIVEKGFSFYPGIKEELIQTVDSKRSYLRGAFLAAGSINHPESSSYHLEIYSSYREHIVALSQLANDFMLNAKWIERKKGFFMYIKEGEKISEFLNIIGAHQALLKFEDVRIVKDMRNSVNRIVNCETANLNKTVKAAMRQIENIQLIDDIIGLDSLPPKLKEVAETRLKYPELTLNELGNYIPSGKVSKSGVNHRLRKIDEIASKLKNN